MTDIVLAAFHGFGVSPETSAIITMNGLVASGNGLGLVFNLADLQRESWAIQHDCSFSRPDAAEGAGFPFDQEAWDTAADVLAGCDDIGPLCMGRAKAARIAALRRAANPLTNYDAAAAAHGAAEVGMLLGVFSTARNARDRFAFIRSLFENEALPRHLGWVPRAFVADVDTVLAVGVRSLQADPVLRQASDAVVATRDVSRSESCSWGCCSWGCSWGCSSSCSWGCSRVAPRVAPASLAPRVAMALTASAHRMSSGPSGPPTPCPSSKWSTSSAPPASTTRPPSRPSAALPKPASFEEKGQTLM